MPGNDIFLTATKSANEKLQKINASIDDAVTVIRNAEQKQSFVVSPSSMHRFAHLQLNSITLWVEYRQLGTSEFVLESIWAHRIQIIENYD